MPNLGSLWYTLGINSKQLDTELKAVEAKLKNLGVTVDVSKIRQTIEASVGATPFNATVDFGNARASLYAVFANKKYDVHVEAIASKLHESIKAALAGWKGAETSILPKKKELRKAVSDALLSSGFEINVGKVKGLNATINNALGSAHTLNVAVDPKKLASAIGKAVGSYKGGKQISVEAKDKVLKDSIRTALRTERFPIKVIVDKAEAQDAVRQALQAAGLQSRTGFTASDKRAWDAQSRRMEAEARAAAASALAQRRLAGAHNAARAATDSHIHSSISLGSAMRGNIRIAGELGPMLASAYSVVALKNFMTKVVEIGGELEKQKLAMKAILGDEGMANTISSQINTLAVKSPFGIMELNQYAKQLTAFQIPYNELYDTMKRMADVSAAVGVDMGRIILAYGQVRAAKFLKGTELRQFTEANIPLIDMLAERFSKLKGEIVSAGDIMDMVSNKEISFEDVKAVLWELTGEGGRFYNMQEVLSESTKAKWKNLADAIDLMFADIAESTSGPLKTTAELLTSLTENWEKVAAVITSAVIAYGTYRAAMLVTNKILAYNTTLANLNSRAIGANLTRWKLFQREVGKGWNNLGKSIKAFFSDMRNLVGVSVGVISAAVTGLALLWENNREEMAKAKEMGDDLFTKATEGAKNLSEAMDGMAQSSEGLGDAALQTGLDKLKQLIKDYSETPNTDITDSLINQQGEVATLAEQYDALMSKVNDLISAYKEAERLNIGKIMGESIEEADSGWFGDNLLTDIEDYKNKWDDAHKDIAKISREYKADIISAVDAAKKADEGFAEATKGMHNYEAMYAELVKKSQNYSDAIEALRSGKGGPQAFTVVMSGVSKFRADSSGLKKSQNKLLAEWEQTLVNVRTRLLMADEDIENLSTPVKMSLITAFKKAMEGMEGPAKKMMEDKVNEILPSIKITNEDLAKTIADNFATALQKASPRLADEMRYGKAYEDLSDAEKSLVEKIMRQAGEDTKKLFPDYADELQRLLDSSDFIAKIQIKFVGGQAATDLQKMLWKGVGVVPTEVTNIFERWSSGATSVEAIGGNAVKEGRDIKARLDAAKKNAHSTKEHIEAIQKEWDDAAFAYQNAGFGSLEDAIKSKSKGGVQEDPFAEAVKERINLLKKAKSEYEGLAKSLGTEAASRELAESPIFAGLKDSKFLPEQAIPQSLDDYEKALDELQEKLTAKGLKSKKHRELNIEIEQLKLDIKKKKIDEALKLALDTVTKEAERQLADWNLFDKIRKATGNQDLAMSIAFGMDADAETDYPALVKKQFDDFAKAAKSTLTFDTATPELLAKAPDEVKKAWEDTTKKLQQYAREQKDAIADILSEYQPLQDKLVKIDADRDRKIKTVKESDMPEADKESYIRRINVEADYDIFTQSNEYLRFFNDIYGLTLDEANRIGDLIQLNLNQMLQAELITIYDYEKEMEKVRKQLESIRNVKPDAMTFLTGGLKGLNQKRLQKEEGSLANNKGYQKALEEQVEAQRKLNEAREQGNFAAILAAQKDLDLANAKVKMFTQVRDAIIKDMEMMENVLAIATFAGSVAQGLSDAFNTIRDMADALGVDTSGGAWDDIAAVMDTLTAVTGGIQKVVQSAMSGDVGGILSGVVSTIATPFTIWAQLHDKKLQKMIDRSKEAAQIMQNQYDILEKQMANFLGNAAAMNTGVEGGAYGKQRQLMQGQLAELQKQRQAEADKKKSDDSVLTDYDRQIQELQISIRDFALEAAKDLYGIDLNGWAEQLGDSLVDAFAAGEDAAKAFDSTVGDIMRDVTSKMISQDILAPMFGDLRRFLFGEDGTSGALGADFTLSPEDAAKMQEYIARIKNKGIPAAQELYDAIDSATGGLLSDSSASDSLREGIEGIKEDQADLLASYLNAVRADVSIQTTIHWPRLLDESLPQISVIAQSQLDCQRRIAEYARRNAEAAEAIVESNDKISRLLVRVTQGGEKFHIQ